MSRPELLSPAGEPDAAYAAFQYGADAVYLGLKKFSARAEAVNFGLDELSEITGFAHSLTPRRRVYVCVNTLVAGSELEELIDCLVGVSDLGVDALIVQDLGVLRIVRERFPDLRLHGSTQLAVHNTAGAVALRGMGFRRVTLARELTLDEIREVAAKSRIEVEVFVHGALCYSYSGLCLFSSLLRGRGGNRGACAYPCRDAFRSLEGAPDGAPPGPCYPFSMKDLALTDDVAALGNAGVAGLKIEGRKKSPLYVACATALYRGLIDGTLDGEQRRVLEDDIKTVFSRPWTRLYVQSRRNRDVTDRNTVGHRGAPIGKAAAAVPSNAPTAWLRFRTERRIELHDGLQLDVMRLGRPFGFAVDDLRLVPTRGRGAEKKVFVAPAGSTVQVALPPERPDISAGDVVYCASSQAVKQRYRVQRPRRPGEFRVRHVADVILTCDAEKVTARASLRPMRPAARTIVATASADGPFAASLKTADMEQTARTAFDRLGDTAFRLGDFSVVNRGELFVPVSVLNRLRRDLTDRLDQERKMATADRATQCRKDLLAPAPPTGTRQSEAPEWSIKFDAFSSVDAFGPDDWAGAAEVVLDIGAGPLHELLDRLGTLTQRIAKDTIRLALPPITRSHEERVLRETIDALLAAGWTRWEVSNLSGRQFLAGSDVGGLDITCNWPLYVVNRLAALELLSMGAKRFVLSPEDGWTNMRELVAEFPDNAIVLVYQDTPLFISETCLTASLAGRCFEGKGCHDREILMASAARERVLAVTRNCRTIVLNDRPYCLGARIQQLSEAGVRRVRADFIHRRYSPEQVARVWRLLRAGKQVPGTREANFLRALG